MSDLIAARAIYAPFLGLVLWDAALKGGPGLKTGVLEAQSKITLTPQYVGKAHDQRLVAMLVKVNALDCEALESTRDRYLVLQNRMVYAGFLCAGGAFTDGPFRYSFSMEHLETRGMRFNHQLTGFSRMPLWRTFIDSDWNQIRTALGEPTADWLQ